MAGETIDYGRAFNVRELLTGAAGTEKPIEREDFHAPPPVEEAELLPSPGDVYRAYSRPGNKHQPMLCFLFKNAGQKALSYGNLESIDLQPAEPGKAPVLMLLFHGLNPLVVRIEGRNLSPLADYLRQHRIAWLRECGPGKEPRDATATVLTAITVNPVEE